MFYQAKPSGGAGVPDRVPVNEDTYAVVYGWMVSRLGLKGSSLFIFASIYGFTMSIGQYTAGVKYLMAWTGVSRAQVYRVLSALEEQGILVSFKRWNGSEWVTAYAAFKTAAEAEAYRNSFLLPGDPAEADVQQKQTSSVGSRKAAAVSGAQLSLPGCGPETSAPVARKNPAGRQAFSLGSRKHAVVPPGFEGGMPDRIYELWKDAGLLGDGASKASFMKEYADALKNIRRLRINCVDFEGAVRNYVALLAVPQERRWWTFRMQFEPFTKNTVLRFLPGRFQLESYLRFRPGMSPAVSGCASEVQGKLDF